MEPSRPMPGLCGSGHPALPASRPEVTKGALDLGAYQVMHKPFELHDLEPVLLKAFASSRP